MEICTVNLTTKIIRGGNNVFNSKVKKESLTELEKSIIKYDKRFKVVEKSSEKLFILRKNSGKKVITPVEDYINTLANSPKEFDKSFSEYKAEFEIFNELIDDFIAESIDTNIQAGSTAAVGVAAGAGTAALMPSVAIGIATTFGTASTGTAISTLSGAAASKAALAWLGGGALAKGGAGIVGGKALLALSGPIGIGIGAAGLIGGGLLASSKNKKNTIKINDKRKEVEKNTAILNAAITEITHLLELTTTHQDGIMDLLNDLKNINKDNYAKFNDFEKQKVGSLVNHIQSLSALLNKKVI